MDTQSNDVKLQVILDKLYKCDDELLEFHQSCHYGDIEKQVIEYTWKDLKKVINILESYLEDQQELL